MGREQAAQRSAPHAARRGRGTVLAVFFSSFPQDFLQGDCTKAKQKLNWKPRVTFDVSGVLCTYQGFMSSKSNPRGWGGALPGHTEKPRCRWPPRAVVLAWKTAATTAAQGVPRDSANLPWKGPSGRQHFGKERVPHARVPAWQRRPRLDPASFGRPGTPAAQQGKRANKRAPYPPLVLPQGPSPASLPPRRSS